MTGLIDALYKRILLAAHPVGSVYQSTASTNPATLFGGTWEAIEGRFLLAAGGGYAAGSEGGEKNVALTESQLPTVTAYVTAWGGTTRLTWGTATSSEGWAVSNDYADKAGAADMSIHFGENQPHNNMPPYLAVYTWRRTA